MPLSRQFFLGGLGALLPILVSALAVDLASLIDHPDVLTRGVCVGYAIRVAILIFLGGTVAVLNGVKEPLTLVQLGIAAPALITSYINGASITLPSQQKTSHFQFFSAAWAQDMRQQQSFVVAGGFLEDVFKGATTNIGSIIQQRQINALIKPEIYFFKIINTEENSCTTTISKAANGDELKTSFPPPKYSIELGECPSTPK